jgi:predicted AAA+ superfamily ATPase
MIKRQLQQDVTEALLRSPAVALLGPRQIGKTTLALESARDQPSIYLDLESERDRAKLANPELYLADHLDRLVILDEVHRAPGLFPVLRGLIDTARREGKGLGRYLLLGSANLDLLKQSGESLAGRITYLELGPLNVLEIGRSAQDALWLRGGFPESYLAASERLSLQWREDFIRSYLERDIPQFGPRIAATTLRRFWTMLAHNQGGLLNVAQLARNLGVDSRTVSGYLDLLADLLLVRRLQPWHANLGKRLVKSPKVYLRDSGLLHALLDVADKDGLLGHPVVGTSWEGFVIENLLQCAPNRLQAFFYRTTAGAEIDLLLNWADGQQWAIEIKRSLAPKARRGFHQACSDLRPSRQFLAYPGTERYRQSETLEVIPLSELMLELKSRAG